ncbi:DegV family protein [Phototrophicus methaneseepsis]|uniref:DegV family protein n=1 Tax=Phototrophicus methaneseepsis TaxID=2710758 RepID=A0A7S8ICQ2_9CHLR|nr:DegV family protein [Phototrophicus methaneseepsis]QPC80549.1 DegV family protein [Phototrophicus methaneseepsis]
MPTYYVVADSGARFSHPRIISQYPVSIVPSIVTINGERYREGVDIQPDELLTRMAAMEGLDVQVSPPSVTDFIEVYLQLSRVADGIISLHPSREVSKSWYDAQRAAHQANVSCPIEVIDTRTLCAGYGMLVRLAAAACHSTADFETIVTRTRDAIDRVYAMYYVDGLDYLRRNGLVSDSRAILGTMLDIKAIVNIEEGKLIVTEKARSMGEATDGLLDFIMEFDAVDDAMILQHRPHISEQTRVLQDRLTVEFPGQHFPYGVYSALMASLIGPHALGIAILEAELEPETDDDDAY